MKTKHNFRDSKCQLASAKKLMIALLLIGTSQSMVGCFSYKAMIVPTTDPVARLTEQVKRIIPGKDYEVTLHEGNKMNIKISRITSDAIFGKIVLKDANGDIIRTSSGQVVNDPNYRIPLAGVADIRARKFSVGKTITAIAVSATAVSIGYILLSHTHDPAPTHNNYDSTDIIFGF